MDCANHAAWVEMWTAVEKALRDSRAVAAWEASELLRAAADVVQHDPWAYEKGKYPRVLWRRLKAAVERSACTLLGAEAVSALRDRIDPLTVDPKAREEA